MGWFDSVTSWVKGAANTIHDSVLKPLFNSALKPLFNNVLKPMAEKAAQLASKVAEKAEKVVDAGIDFAVKQADNMASFGKMLSNPIVMIGGLIVGGLVLSKVLDSKR